MKKKLTFLSGLLSFNLLFAPVATNTYAYAYAAEDTGVEDEMIIVEPVTNENAITGEVTEENLGLGDEVTEESTGVEEENVENDSNFEEEFLENVPDNVYRVVADSDHYVLEGEDTAVFDYSMFGSNLEVYFSNINTDTARCPKILGL